MNTNGEPARLLRVMAHPTRLEILAAIADEGYGGQIPAGGFPLDVLPPSGHVRPSRLLLPELRAGRLVHHSPRRRGARNRPGAVARLG
jgi:hypothetical protein